MSVESGTFISDLNPASPGPTDPKSEGDDHLRFIKSTVKATFPNVTGAVNATHTALNQLTAAAVADSTGHIVITPTAEGGSVLAASRTGAANVGLEAVVGSVASLGMGVNNSGSANSWGAATSTAYLMTPQNYRLSIGQSAVEKLGITATAAAFSVPVTGTSFNGFLANGNISQFNNDLGYLTSIGSLPSLTVTGAVNGGGVTANGNGGVAAVSAYRATTGTQAALNIGTTGGSTWQIFIQSGTNDLAIYNTSVGANVMGFSQSTGAVGFLNSVTAGTFIGALQGNATSATTAGSASSATTATTATLANSATTALSLTGNANLTGSGGLTIAGTPSRFESSNITIQAGTYAYPGVSHGGSRKPDIAQAFYRCTTATGAFSVGDYVEVQNVNSGGASQIWTSATQVGMTQLTSSALYVKDASSGTPIGATSNFALVFICHWL